MTVEELIQQLQALNMPKAHILTAGQNHSELVESIGLSCAKVKVERGLSGNTFRECNATEEGAEDAVVI